MNLNVTNHREVLTTNGFVMEFRVAQSRAPRLSLITTINGNPFKHLSKIDTVQVWSRDGAFYMNVYHVTGWQS